MLARLQASLRQTLRRTAFGVAGGLFLILGIGFLTAAVWLTLAIAHGGLFASVILGLVFCGVGLVFLALSARKPAQAPAPIAVATPTAAKAPLEADLMAAFLGGLDAGRAMARRSSD